MGFINSYTKIKFVFRHCDGGVEAVVLSAGRQRKIKPITTGDTQMKTIFGAEREGNHYVPGRALRIKPTN